MSSFPAIDYESLLRKYVAHVVDENGAAFTTRLSGSRAGSFSLEEQVLLLLIERDALDNRTTLQIRDLDATGGLPRPSVDRCWKITFPYGEGRVWDYNWELMGFDEVFRRIDPETFCYGGNAYYVTGAYAQKRGWVVEEVPRETASAN